MTVGRFSFPAVKTKKKYGILKWISQRPRDHPEQDGSTAGQEAGLHTGNAEQDCAQGLEVIPRGKARGTAANKNKKKGRDYGIYFRRP